MSESELLELEQYCREIEVRPTWPSIPEDAERAKVMNGLLKYQFTELFRLARLGLNQKKWWQFWKWNWSARICDN